jgi:branched-chain amino acid transport system permease protein
MNRALIVLAVLLGAALAALPLYAGDYLLGIGLALLMWIALTQSWVLLSGLTGYVSIGHVVFFGLGAYVVVLAREAVPLWVALPAAGIAAFVFAFLIGYPVLRVRGPYFVILTFGLAELVKYIVVNIESALGRFSRLVFGAPTLETLYALMLLLAAFATALLAWVRWSRLGRGLIAIREDEEAAETVGVPVAWFKLIAFGLSALVPAMVGGVMVLRSSYFEPIASFNPVISLTIVTIGIIGGSDDIKGPLPGAVLLVAISELLWVNAPQVYMILLGLLLIGFVLWLPDGIGGVLARRGTR